MMRTSSHYELELVNASMSALVELSLSLRSFRDRIVLVGGWAPYFLLEDHGRGTIKHVGSIDIDLAVEPGSDPDLYHNIVDIIESRGYRMKRGRTGEPIPSSFIRDLTSGEKEYEIQVDFLTTMDPDREGHRTRVVDRDLRARMIPECALAFKYNYFKNIEGILPGDGEIETEIRMLDITGCLGMKGRLLGERYKEKDAYDIYTVVADCMDSPKAVAGLVRGHLTDPMVRDSVDMIRKRFGSMRAAGTNWVGNFIEPFDTIARERAIAQVYITMKEFMDGL
ncbi:MAG: hypothetical protein QCI82_04340 [Candidatus Thermoplasmatota archaeon]|nr:hypothetical protein [Candidatus Thermoplasmatota archaeon]